jgi:hypothetical protein
MATLSGKSAARIGAAYQECNHVPIPDKQGGGETRSWKKTRDDPFLRTCCPLILHALKPHGILWMCPYSPGRP